MDNAKLTLIADIRKHICMPEQDFLRIGNDFLRISYQLNGEQKYILCCSKEDAAEWLKEKFFIDDYDVRDGELWLSVDTLETSVGKHNEPVQFPKIQWFTWQEFQDAQDEYYHPLYLDKSLILHACANHEWDKTIAVIIKGID